MRGSASKMLKKTAKMVIICCIAALIFLQAFRVSAAAPSDFPEYVSDPPTSDSPSTDLQASNDSGNIFSSPAFEPQAFPADLQASQSPQAAPELLQASPELQTSPEPTTNDVWEAPVAAVPNILVQKHTVFVPAPAPGPSRSRLAPVQAPAEELAPQLSFEAS